MPGEDHKNVTIAIKDDQLTEEPENIIVELTATNTNQISIERSSAIVLIHDDDGKVWFFVVNIILVNSLDSDWLIKNYTD